MNENYSKWNRLAPLGLGLIGLGLSLTGHAIIAKSKDKGWFLTGTLGLILVNSGIAIFGESVKARALYEAELAQLQRRTDS